MNLDVKAKYDRLHRMVSNFRLPMLCRMEYDEEMCTATCHVRGLQCIMPSTSLAGMKNVELAREDIDRQLQDERDEVDRIVKEAREEMDLKLKLQRSEIDINILEERMSMDQKLKEERQVSDRRLKEERARSDRMLKEERDALDRKLQKERQNMDRTLELERVEMDGIKMMARANMERKLLQDLTHDQPDPIEPSYEPDLSFDSLPRPHQGCKFILSLLLTQNPNQEQILLS
ncbi:hypothetical protein U9M48_031636 [Paspalum notatum var. saurae]|uniref:Uncharacterized protein n=1 Tax=Paspalum notatum var. saurae TaxID=547442 RepID=A0AAQ3U668_PASNO